MAKTVVKWYGNAVSKQVLAEAQKLLNDAAFDARQIARDNLTEGDHIDTKVLYNSVYAATPDTVSPTPPSGKYASLKGHGQVRREVNEPQRPGPKGAIVGATADYAVFVEMEDPFLFRAAEQAVVGRFK